jgi:hypothetical protein
MKKISISLVAGLAVVLAVTSAFTTNSHKAITFRHYGLTPNTYSTTPSVAVVEAGTLIYDAGTSDITIAQAISNSAADDGCNADATFLCAGEVKNNNGTKTVNETKLGDFFVNP